MFESRLHAPLFKFLPLPSGRETSGKRLSMTAKNATELLRNRAAGGGVKQLDRDRLTGRRGISLPAPPPPGLVVKLLYSGTRGGAKEKKKTENTRGVILSLAFGGQGRGQEDGQEVVRREEK